MAGGAQDGALLNNWGAVEVRPVIGAWQIIVGEQLAPVSLQ
jgi:hypothetical protein